MPVSGRVEVRSTQGRVIAVIQSVALLLYMLLKADRVAMAVVPVGHSACVRCAHLLRGMSRLALVVVAEALAVAVRV